MKIVIKASDELVLVLFINNTNYPFVVASTPDDEALAHFNKKAGLS